MTRVVGTGGALECRGLSCALLAGVALSCAAPAKSQDPNVAGEVAAPESSERGERLGDAESDLPRLHVAPGHISLDGARVAENDAPAPRRIDELTAAIRGLEGRESKAARSSDDSSGHYLLAADDEVSAAELKSAFQTAAFAGWRRARVGAGADEVALDAFVPVVGDDTVHEVLWPERVLALVVRESAVEVWRVRLGAPPVPQGSDPGQGGGLGLTGVPPENGTDETGKKTDEKAVQTARVGKDRLEEELGALLAAECEQAACSPALLFAEDAARFALLRNALTGLARAAARTSSVPLVQFRIGDFDPKVLPARSARIGGKTVSGRLPPEVIQKTVRENFQQLRACYMAGLDRDPKLTGRVVTRFVIGRDGAVSAAGFDESSTMADAEVVTCVTRVFLGLVFPKPEGGIVTVVYPIQFSPE